MSEFKLDLDDEPVKQPNTVVAEVLVVPQQPAAVWPMVVLVGAVCFWLGWSFNQFDQSPLPDDRRETVEPVDPKPDDTKPAIDLKSVTLVVIHDKDVTNATPEYAASLADDQFADWCQTSIKDIEVLTTEDEIAKQVIASGKFQLPVVVAYSGKKYIWDMPLPKGSMDSIRKKLEGK